jgi:hypothetical protein
MSNISQTEPSQHFTHWTHMDEMKWFSSAMLGVLAANNLGFAWLWLRSAKPFGQRQCQGDMSCPKSARQSILNIVTSLIMDPYGAMNSMLAANTLMVWLGCG